MYSATVPASPWRAISVENMASLVVPMNCSFSARVSVWPDRSSRSDRTAKCSGSLSMSTPSMSKMMASNRAIQPARGEGDDVHAIGEMVRQDGQTDQQADLAAGPKGEPDGQTVERAVRDHTDRAENGQRRDAFGLGRVLVDLGRRRRGGGALVLVLPRFAVDERLQGREQEEADDGCGAGQDRVGVFTDEVGGFGQQIRQRGGNQDTRGKSHERMKSMAQPDGRGTTQQGGEERQDRKGNQHGAGERTLSGVMPSKRSMVIVASSTPLRPPRCAPRRRCAAPWRVSK